MAQKKYTTKNNETFIDVELLLKNWWYFKKLVIFGSLIATLLALFIVILFNNAPLKINTSNYISAVLKGDLLVNNDRIVAGLRSAEILNKTLQTLGFDLPSHDVQQSIVVQKATNPLAENLQEYIVNLALSDIKKLAISEEVLTSIMVKIKNTSEDLISIKFHYKPLSLTELQAKNLINLLVRNTNMNIILNSNRQNIGLKLINATNQIVMARGSDSERFSRLFNISNNIRDNLLKLSKNYSGILIGFNISELTNRSVNMERLLYQISEKRGNTSSADNLKIKISEIDRNLSDLSKTLSYIDNRNNQSEVKYSLSNTDENPSFQIDDKLFDKIISIGDVLSLSEFRKETLITQGNLQKEKNNLISQVESLQLSFNYNEIDLTIDSVEKRILTIADEVNSAINQVRSFTNPTDAVEFVQNPELVKIDTSNNNTKYLIKIIITFSIISFLCLSFIAFLLNPKSSRRT